MRNVKGRVRDEEINKCSCAVLKVKNEGSSVLVQAQPMKGERRVKGIGRNRQIPLGYRTACSEKSEKKRKPLSLEK